MTGTRLRGGTANSARGAESFLRESIGAARKARASGILVARGDSAFRTLHIDLSEEYSEALGGLLLDDPAHSDGTGHELDVILTHD